ncbi:MAG: DNA phosphorothioation-dependent restriction protein DptF [Sarcina sp.]
MLYKILENIENDKKHLEDLAEYIDKNIYTDPVTVISKGRTFAEFITSMIIMQEENLEYATSLKQVERISELNNKGIIPKEIVDYLHTVRKLGNIAVHDIVEGALGSALTVHKALYKIVCWYIEQYIKVSFTQEEYIEPTIESSNKEEKEIMERLKLLEIKLNGNIDTNVTIEKKSCYLEIFKLQLSKILNLSRWETIFDMDKLVFTSKCSSFNERYKKEFTINIIVERPQNAECTIKVEFGNYDKEYVAIVGECVRSFRSILGLSNENYNSENVVFSFTFEVKEIISSLDDTERFALKSSAFIEAIISQFFKYFNEEKLILWINESIENEENKNEKQKENNEIIEVKEKEDEDDIEAKKSIAKKEKTSKSCLVEELKKLKESAKEAVEGLDEFSSFKKYMHIDRTMHKKLEALILESNKSAKQKLILVCGSAGDGKSHIISYLKDKHSDVMDNFKLWNDATESLDPKKTAMDTLNDVLKAFNDENIDTNNEKMILAINLGTLNNFIDSKYGENYTLFKKFVYEKKILDTTISDNEYDANSSFEFVNFGDYHIYELENGEEKSAYISRLIDKITKSSNRNTFYKSYCDNCLNCENKNTCPIKFNYELLGQEQVNEKVVKVLIEAIVKNKLIIPTRALLNFIFDILVGKLGVKGENLIFKKSISSLSENAFIDSLLPNILFEQEDISYIFRAIRNLDPLNIKMNNLDDFIIEFNTAEKVDIYFKENLDIPEGYLEKVFETDLESKVNHKLRDKLLTLFIRQFRLASKTELFNLSDEVYQEYIRDVYYWNRGDKRELKNIYTNVKTAILKWNGDSQEKEINIFIGKKQSKYKISEEIEIKPDTTNLIANSDVKLERFLEDLNLIYKVKDRCFNFDIDYSLYKTLSKINRGYRPNKIDKSHYIKFVESLNNIIECGSQDEFIFFTEKNKEKNKKYKLEYDEDFGFEFKEVK